MHWHHSSVCNVILLHHSWILWLETEVRNIHSILQSFFTLSDRRRLDYNSDHHSACSGWPHQLIGSIATSQWKNDISVCRGGGTAQCTDIFPLYWCKKYLFDFSRILLTSITSQNIMDFIEMVPRWYPHTEVHGDGVLDVHGYRHYSWKIKNSILSPYSIVQAAELLQMHRLDKKLFVCWLASCLIMLIGFTG